MRLTDEIREAILRAKRRKPIIVNSKQRADYVRRIGGQLGKEMIVRRTGVREWRCFVLGDRDATLVKSRMQGRAYGLLRRAKREGVIVRGKCFCGKVGHSHHADYSKPLEVQWLCRKHHSQHHGFLGHPTIAEKVRWKLKNVS